jgi:RNA polymerase sigma-70 factor (ECF subfamily)
MGDDREESFEELFKYYPAVVALLLRLGFNREDAQDLAQEVFVRVFKGMDGYRGESRLSYLERITRRLAYNDFRDRHAAKRDGVTVPAEDILGLSDPGESVDKTIERNEREQRLYDAVDRLPPSDRTALRLQLAGHTLQEIAAKLAITIPALKSRLNVARKRLRELLGEEPEDDQ